MSDIQQEEVKDDKKSKTFDVQAGMDKAELFMDKNKKQFYYVIGVLVLLVGGFLTYKLWYLPGQEEEAQKAAYYAFYEFEKDSLNTAVKGGQKVRTAENRNITTVGLEKIAEEYGSTDAGNLANYQLGCVYMRQGQFQKAIDKFEEFDGKDVIVSSIAIGATGDCYMELNKTEEAIKHYLKAADKNSNAFTSPIYLKKAGLAYETQKQYAEAVKAYERIQREYSKSQEARDIVKYITRAKALGKL